MAGQTYSFPYRRSDRISLSIWKFLSTTQNLLSSKTTKHLNHLLQEPPSLYWFSKEHRANTHPLQISQLSDWLLLLHMSIRQNRVEDTNFRSRRKLLLEQEALVTWKTPKTSSYLQSEKHLQALHTFRQLTYFYQCTLINRYCRKGTAW